MEKKILWAGSTVLHAPTTLSINDEIIWTSSTGRGVSGKMIGNPVAEKKTAAVKWEFLTEKEVKLIKSKIVKGYFPISFHDDGVDLTIQGYRGTMAKEVLGDIGDGQYYYRKSKNGALGILRFSQMTVMRITLDW